MKVWIARDKNGDLSMYNAKPKKMDKFFMPGTIAGKKVSWWILPKDRFPKITWENSPVKYEVDMTFDEIKTKKGVES